ncbi:MAG TPA: hypothetical protein DFS52_15610 [Myxococcales bacterium]|nr:hypothetical protein [Myxococcales bacterium]
MVKTSVCLLADGLHMERPKLAARAPIPNRSWPRQKPRASTRCSSERVVSMTRSSLRICLPRVNRTPLRRLAESR